MAMNPITTIPMMAVVKSLIRPPVSWETALKMICIALIMIQPGDEGGGKTLPCFDLD